MDHLRSGVQDQPGHHGETPSKKKKRKGKKRKEKKTKGKERKGKEKKERKKERRKKERKKISDKLGAVAYACNPSTLGG